MERTTLLTSGAQTLGLTLSEQQVDALLAYIALLAKWNKAYNLTAVREPKNMITHHLLDSLAIAPFILGDRILDVGSGAGLPGIPLAIVYPQKSWVLLDSNGKKIRFLQQAIGTVKLKNVTTVQVRAENYQPNQKFDVILARALGSLHDIIKATRHCCAEKGRFLLMKGVYPAEELDQTGLKAGEYQVHQLTVPGLDAQRHLVEIKCSRGMVASDG